jgi:inward rectifier potassium channel
MSRIPSRSRTKRVEVDTSRPEALTQSRQGTSMRMPATGRASTILRVGLRQAWHGDLYHRALTLRWPSFFGVAAVVYLLANAVFALLFLAQAGSITNARDGSFADAFFFSVQTFGTIGYGVMAPATTWANIVMTMETLTGIMLVALTTGVMFARVSRPTARVLFSKVAVVSNYDGVPTLMVRMGNERLSQIIQAEVTMSVVRNERTSDGHTMRRFYDLKLARDRTPVFAMSFQVMHHMVEGSPLFGATHASLVADEAELIVTVSGLDETMGANVHARASYLPDEIRYGHRYVDIFGVTPEGRRAIDYRRFHDSEAV